MAKKVFGNVSLVGILALLLIIAFALLWKRNTLSNFEDLSTGNALMMYQPDFRARQKEYIPSGVSMSGGPSLGGGMGGRLPPGIQIIKPNEVCKKSLSGNKISTYALPGLNVIVCVDPPSSNTTNHGAYFETIREQDKWLKSAGAYPVKTAGAIPMNGGMSGPSMGGGMGGPSMGGMGGPSMGGMAGSSMMIYPSTIPAGIKLIKPMESCGLSPQFGGGSMMWKVPSFKSNACVPVAFTQNGVARPSKEHLDWLKSVGAYPVESPMGGPSMKSMGGPSMGGPSMGGGMGGPSMGGMGGPSMMGPSNECMELRKVTENLSKQLSQVYEKQKYYKC